jgi:riboflavin transporter FmnP
MTVCNSQIDRIVGMKEGSVVVYVYPEVKGVFFMKFSSRQIAISGAFAALSATVQLVHIGYQSPTWGMWIDIVAVTWFVAYFLFGLQSSLLVSLVGSLIITFFAPDTWLGASMKFIATISVILLLFSWVTLRHKKLNWYANPYHLIIPLIISMIIRSCLVLPLNYYYAIPIWTGMTPSEAMKVIPWLIIVIFNVIQTIFDVIFAWVIVYKFKLSRFADDIHV